MKQHPSEIIKKELDRRNWTNSDLAYILDVPAATVSGFFSKKHGISAARAKDFAVIFGNGPQDWMHIQTDYELDKARKAKPGIKGRVRQVEKKRK